MDNQEMFDNEVCALSVLLEQQLEEARSSLESNLVLMDPELDDDANLTFVFALETAHKDCEGKHCKVIYHGVCTIDYTKGGVHFSVDRRDDPGNWEGHGHIMPLMYWDNYDANRRIYASAKRIAEAIFA
jgi:hypothetical protein